MGNKSIIFIYLSIVLIAIYLFINPLLPDFFHLLRHRNFSDITLARNYYQIISSFFSTLFGLLGVALGWFYFQNRKKSDRDEKDREKKRARLERFLNKLDSYDSLVRRILFKNIDDQKSLNIVRTEIGLTFDIMLGLLDVGNNLLGLEEKDTKLVLKVNSFVDKTNIIMHEPLKQLLSTPTDLLAQEYLELIYYARRACHNKIS